MKSKIKLIIFDAAGVTWTGGVPATSKLMAEKYKLPLKSTGDVFDREFIYSWRNNLKSHEGWEKAARELGLKESGKQIEKIHFSLHKPMVGMIRYADELRARGYRCIILSNNFDNYVRVFNNKFKLEKHFDEILNSQNLGMGKQDPRLFEYVMKKYGVTAEQTVYFDDIGKGLIVPAKLGIHTIHFKKEQQLKKDLEKLLTPTKLIVLDFHGILVKGDYKPVCRMLAKKHKVKWQDVYEVLYKTHFRKAVVGEIPESQVYLRTFKHFGWKGESWREAHEYHKNAMQLNKCVYKLALQLQKKGYTLLMLSQNTSDQFKSYIKRFDLKKDFKYITNTFDLGVPKASRETTEWIKKEFGVKSNEVIFCDDQEGNLVAAKKDGMKTIHYKNFKQFKSDLTKFL